MPENFEQPKVPDVEKTAPPLLDEQQRRQWSYMTQNNYFQELEWPESFIQSEEFKSYVARPEVLTNIKRSINYTPAKIFNYYQSVLQPELLNSILASPEVQEGVKKEVETILADVSNYQHKKNLKRLLSIFPDISNDPNILKTAQDKIIEQVKSFPGHSVGWRLEAILYLAETFDLPKDFLQSSEILSIFPAILKSVRINLGTSTSEAEVAKKFATVIGLSNEQTKKMVLDSVVDILADYTQSRSSYGKPAPSAGLKEVQQVFAISDEELGLKDRVPMAIEKALTGRGYVGLFFKEITDLIRERNIQLEIPPEWEELANKRAENNINPDSNSVYNVGELRRLI